MFKGFSRLASCATIVAATLSPMAAHAVIIDFEGDDLGATQLAPGDSVTTNGFVLTQGFDAGLIDVGTGLKAAAPTNNDTQFYTNTNDGELIFTSLGGLPFSLNGFDAAFVPLLGSHAAAQVIGIVAFATAMDGTQFGTIFGLGDTTSTTKGSPFITFAGAADFGTFTNLKTLEFFTCAVVNGQVCLTPTKNNGQFALDNVNLAIAAPVPEPETTALLALGLMVLTAVARRRRSR